METDPAISLKHVSVRFESTVVHRDISFDVRCGEVVTLLGPSGTGKTVILKLIIGLLQPTSGTVHVLGSDLSRLKYYEMRELRKNLGMLFQGAALFDSLSVYDNVAYSLREFGQRDERKIRAIVMEKLDIVGLSHKAFQSPPQLSGGQRKRVGLARALASSPRIMLFDEPTTGLDPTATKRIDELILRMKRDFGIASVVVTHDIASARRVSDRWILLNDGAVVAAGPVDELSRHSPPVVRFIEGAWQDDGSGETSQPQSE